jgi:hypothetical protein
MKNLYLAIKRNPKIFAFSLFFGITSTWALLEPFITIYFSSISKYWFFLFFIPPSLLIAFIKTYPKNNIRIELKNTNTTVNIKFGDIFNQTGVIAIAVNEYFDSEIGKPVSDKSMHGYFIKNVLGGKKEIFDDAINETLNDQLFINSMRNLGKSKKFPIGTTASLDFGDNKYLMFALSKTNENFEAYTNPSLLLEALDGLFTKARSECNGHDLFLPLIGTGLSRSGIPPKYIIELILISILKSTKQNEITGNINIIIENAKFDQIDLNGIKRKWN